MSSTVSDGTTTVVPWIVNGYQASQSGQSIVHQVLGASAPDVTVQPVGLRTGTLNLVFVGWDAAEACRAMCVNASGPLSFADGDVSAAAMSFVVASGGVQTHLDTASGMWMVDVAFQEIPA